MISPQQGLLDKAPELGAVYLPGSTDLLSGYLETGNGSGLSKLEEEYRAKSIAHVRSNDVAMEKQKWESFNNSLVFRAFQLPYTKTNPPPWYFIERSDRALAKIEKTVYEFMVPYILASNTLPKPQTITDFLSSLPSEYFDVTRFVKIDNPCDRESSGEENEHEVLKPFIAIQRVQLPPGKGQPTSRKRALHGGRRRPS